MKTVLAFPDYMYVYGFIDICNIWFLLFQIFPEEGTGVAASAVRLQMTPQATPRNYHSLDDLFREAS